MKDMKDIVIKFVQQDCGRTVANVLDFRLAQSHMGILIMLIMLTTPSMYECMIHFVFSGLFLTLKHLFSGMQSDHAILINPDGEIIRFGIMSTDTFRLNTAGKEFIVNATTECFTPHCC